MFYQLAPTAGSLKKQIRNRFLQRFIKSIYCIQDYVYCITIYILLSILSVTEYSVNNKNEKKLIILEALNLFVLRWVYMRW